MATGAKPTARLYRRLAVARWSDPRVLALSAPKPNAQTLLLYLESGPHTGVVPGLFVAGPAGLAEGLGWPVAATRRCLEEILAQGIARLDPGTRLIWLPEALAINAPQSPNVAVAWAKALVELPPSPLRDEAQQAIEQHLKPLGEKGEFLEAFTQTMARHQPKPSAKPFPKPSPKPRGISKSISKRSDNSSPPNGSPASDQVGDGGAIAPGEEPDQDRGQEPDQDQATPAPTPAATEAALEGEILPAGEDRKSQEREEMRRAETGQVVSGVMKANIPVFQRFEARGQEPARNGEKGPVRLGVDPRFAETLNRLRETLTAGVEDEA